MGVGVTIIRAISQAPSLTTHERVAPSTEPLIVFERGHREKVISDIISQEDEAARCLSVNILPLLPHGLGHTRGKREECVGGRAHDAYCVRRLLAGKSRVLDTVLELVKQLARARGLALTCATREKEREVVRACLSIMR